MKLAHKWILVGLGTASLAAIAYGCGGSSSPAPSNAGSNAPPTRPNAPATTSTDEHNYAIHQLFLGDSDRQFATSTSAWKSFGFNIDGKVSTKDSTDVCTPIEGGGKDVHNNGNGGIDNSFGAKIVPIIQTFTHDISKTISDAVGGGSFTVMFDTVGLSSDPAQTNTGLKAKLFEGDKFPGTPSWSTSDVWPVDPLFLSNKSDATSSTAILPNAFVLNGLWVSGDPSDVSLSIKVFGQTLSLTVHVATVVFQHDGSKGDNGIIGGVLDTEELVAGLKTVAGRLNESLCGSAAFDSIAKQIRGASDILKDGTNAAGVPCNAVSIGIGFSADEIGKPQAVAVPSPPPPDKCDGGGTGDDGGGGDAGDDGGGGDAATGG
jgi:hypothetical protein